MTKKESMPSFRALPIVAMLVYFISIIIFEQNPNEVHAAVVKGFLTSWTPILVIWGAIFLFQTMNYTGAMKTIQNWLNTISNNKIAQLMIVGWAFPFLIEGASGFGTPAALAAPILVGLGFPVVEVAIMALIMNSVPVSFGAVGTPTWFGFSNITDITHAEMLEVGSKSAIIHGVAALVIPILALTFVATKKEIKKNIVFIYLSIFLTVIPYIVIAFYNYEFPALIGGFIGLIGSVILAKNGIGLAKQEDATSKKFKEVPVKELLKASFPLWGTVLILVITRIPQLGINQLITSTEHMFDLPLGSFGNFWMSPSLTLGLESIFGTSASWSHKLLYVPSIMPFGFIVLITFFLFKTPKGEAITVFKGSVDKMKNTSIALFGALIFVNLMMLVPASVNGAESLSAVGMIGNSLSQVTGESWQYFSAVLGAVGSFFSGSGTISNLTFGVIQNSIALDMGLDRTLILATQSVGGAMGNMVCINNIVAVSSVLGIVNMEGYILKKTVKVLVVYAVIAALMTMVL